MKKYTWSSCSSVTLCKRNLNECGTFFVRTITIHLFRTTYDAALVSLLHHESVHAPHAVITDFWKARVISSAITVVLNLMKIRSLFQNNTHTHTDSTMVSFTCFFFWERKIGACTWSQLTVYAHLMVWAWLQFHLVCEQMRYDGKKLEAFGCLWASQTID